MNHDNGGEYTERELLRMIRRWVPRDRVPKRVRIKDTSDFFRVDYDDVVVRSKDLSTLGKELAVISVETILAK